MPSRPSSTPRSDLFWPKVRWDQHGCWEWQASRYINGYGQFHFPGGKGVRAHRAAWIIMYGPIPERMVIMHRCDNRGCVRPDHLRLGTQAENMRDMAAKGRRGDTGRRRRLEACRRGHSEWYTGPSGRRTCKPCRRAAVRTWSKARRANA